MRIDKEGNQRTLEQDILEIWGLHGWDVIEERVNGNTWEITAEAKSSKHSFNTDFKKICPECGFAVRIQEAKLLPRHKFGCSMKGKPIQKS